MGNRFVTEFNSYASLAWRRRSSDLMSRKEEESTEIVNGRKGKLLHETNPLEH